MGKGFTWRTGVQESSSGRPCLRHADIWPEDSWNTIARRMALERAMLGLRPAPRLETGEAAGNQRAKLAYWSYKYGADYGLSRSQLRLNSDLDLGSKLERDGMTAPVGRSSSDKRAENSINSAGCCHKTERIVTGLSGQTTSATTHVPRRQWRTMGRGFAGGGRSIRTLPS